MVPFMLRRWYLVPRAAIPMLAALACGGGGGGGGGGNPSASVTIQSSAVTPASPFDGQPFVASATLAYADCDNPAIKFSYGALTDSAAGSTRQAGFDAVFGQNSVAINGYCGGATASLSQPVAVALRAVDSRNLVLTPSNPLSGASYTASGQGVGVGLAADSVAGIAPDGVRQVVHGPGSTLPFSHAYTATQGGIFRLITYGAGAAPDTAVATLVVRAPATPVIAPIAAAVLVEDDSARTTLTATNCTNPVWSLGTPDHPDYTPSLSGGVLTRRFAPDASGSGNVAVGVSCAEGTAPPVSASLTVSAQPDLVVQLEEIAGGVLPGTVRLGVNGSTYAVQNGDRIQLTAGQNTLQLVSGQAGLLDLASWSIPGAREIPLNLNLTSYLVTLGAADLVVSVGVLRDDHPDYSGQARIDVDAAYIGKQSVSFVTGFPGDTNKTYTLTRIQVPVTLNGTVINAPMTQGSFDAWGAIIDSIRTDDSVAAAATGRPRKTFIVQDYDGTGVAPPFVFNPVNNAWCPPDGRFYMYDQPSGTPGGGVCLDANRNILSGGAHVTANTSYIGGRQTEASVWSDGARSDDASSNQFTRNSSGAVFINTTSRRPGDWFYNKFIRPKADKLAELGYGNLKLH